MRGTRDAGYSLTELFAIKFVLADVVIIFALVFAGPLYAVAITALLVVSVFLTWYLTQRVGSQTVEGSTESGDEATEPSVDPVTELQTRYAVGALTDEEFERKLDRLIEANERAEAAGVETTELSLE